MTAVQLGAAPDLWQTALTSFAPERHRARALRLARRLPLLAVLALQVVLTLRLHNVANPDEALYIDAGHALLRQWSGGPAAPDYGSYFSGLPYAYPVLAAGLDHLGGLALVRGASLLMLLGTTLCVRELARHLAPEARRSAAGLVAALLFATSAPVLFVGNFATYDAPCVLLVALAAVAAVRRHGGLLPVVLAALAVSGAAVVKYVGVAFVPVVLLLAVLSAPRLVRGVPRGVVVGATAVASLVDVFITQRQFIEGGIVFTTAHRAAENPRPTAFLLHSLALGGGVLVALALLGLGVLVRSRRDWRTVTTALVMLGAGLLVPASQLRIHEYTSFNKHVAFLTLFLAPVAAQLVAVPSRSLRVPLVAVGAYAALVAGVLHATTMFDEWPDPTHVVRAVEQHGVAGPYLGIGADALGYQARGHDQFSFQEPYAVFGAGEDAIRAAVAGGTYAGFFYTSGTSGNAELDADDGVVADALAHDSHYVLAGSWPKHRYDRGRYYLWVRTTPPVRQVTP